MSINHLIGIFLVLFLLFFKINCKNFYVSNYDPYLNGTNSLSIDYPDDPVSINTSYNLKISLNSNASYFLINIVLNSNVTIFINSTTRNLQISLMCNKTGLNCIDVNVTNLYNINGEFYVFGVENRLRFVDSSYMGCFGDSSDRDIRAFVGSSDTNTIENCANTCSEYQTTYAGVQYTWQCFCDDRYGTLGTATNCNMECSGNKNQTCGGSWANNVYYLIYGLLDLNCTDSNVKINQTFDCTVNVKLTQIRNFTIVIDFGDGTNLTSYIDSKMSYRQTFSKDYTAYGAYSINTSTPGMRIPFQKQHLINVQGIIVNCTASSIYSYQVLTLPMQVYGIYQDVTIDFDDGDVRLFKQNSALQYQRLVVLKKFYLKPGNYTLKIYDSIRSNNAYCYYNVTNKADIDFDNINNTVNLLSGVLDITDCLTNCSNSGYCSLVAGSKYECTCYDGFIGKFCQYEKKPCQLPMNECLNDGVCIDIVTNDTFSYECNCTGPYKGRQCETRNNEICKNRTCSSQGVCFLNETSTLGQCSCYKNYYGENCEHESESLKTIKTIISFSSLVAIIVVAFTYLFIVFLDLSDLCIKHKKSKRKPKIRRFRYYNFNLNR